MITRTIKNKIDKIWKDIWASGLTQPITVIEQITYLMFIRSLDQKDIDAEAMENLTGQKQNKIFSRNSRRTENALEQIQRQRCCRNL
ncbi:MAG: type I restriction-modification system subunit M N-terminal domain-containing protein [Coprococcus sp.]